MNFSAFLPKEVEEDAGLYKEFLLWANSPESVEKKKQIYISDFVAVFGRFPEGWAQEELESANGTEVAPAPKSSYLRRRTGR